MDKTRHLTAIAVLAAWQLTGQIASAGEQDGVQCPSAFAAEISDSNRALKCVKKAAYRLKSVCHGFDLLTESGTDDCFGIERGNHYPSIPALGLPGTPPASEFRRIINKTGIDEFVADDFRWPVKLPPYSGDPSKGVRCASGWDGDEEFSGDGIRCDKYQGSPIEADCDFGWTVDRDRLGQEDRCLGVNEGPTKPMGMTKVQFDVERALPTVGWVLDKRSGTDLWRKKVYRYPDLVP